MKKGQLFIISCIVFCVCCSMSKCNTDAQGPETITEGNVTDAVTGLPIAGLSLKIGNENNQNVQHVVTNAQGYYYIKFTPEGDQSYIITPGSPYANSYNNDVNTTVYLGVDNIINLQLVKLVNLSIHLVNNSSYNKQVFVLSVSSNYGYYNESLYFYPAPKIDTTFKTTGPYLSYYNIESEFFNGSMYSDPTAETFTKSIFVGKVDTTVNIINP